VPHRLFNTLAALSLILFLATYWLAVKSFDHPFPDWRRLVDHGRYRLVLVTGDIEIRSVETRKTTEIPMALPLAAFAVLPTKWLFIKMNLRRKKRQEAQTALALQQMQHCRTCGHDLRATPDQCPECGRPVGSLQSWVIRDAKH
jgi:ribosomal protein L32